MAKPDNLKASCTVVVDIPADHFDLASWLPNFSNEECLACTPVSQTNQYVFGYRCDNGELVFRDDESAAGFMMTQLYRPEVMEPRHVFLVSPRNKARFLGVVPLYIQVTWDMKVEAFGSNRSKFTCIVGCRMNPLLLLGGALIRLSYWTQAHTEEETPHFAESAVRWAKQHSPTT